jgi:hypothetical protein
MTLLMAAGLLMACPSDPPAPDASAVDASGDGAGSPDATPDPGPPADPRCCSDGLCGFGEACIQGSCLPAPGASGCYKDSECGPGQQCQDAVVCETCGVETPTCAPHAGQCRYPAGCCNGPADCAAGEVCVQGTCQGPPADTQRCWAASHCAAGLACEAVPACPCGVSGCTAEPGWCAVPGVCCIVDAECGPGGRCVAGACQAAPSDGACYADADCGPSRACAGASLCPCGSTACSVPTTAGRCVDPAAAACLTSADCGATRLCLEGATCATAPSDGACFFDGHCGVGRLCQGAVVCPDGQTCEAPTAPGTCVTQATACQADADCPVAMTCVVPDRAYCPGEGEPAEGVCVAAVDSACWTSDQCPLDRHCTGESICTSPIGCTEPNRPGFCETFPYKGDCCDSHRDCGAGYECRNSNSTISCPPNGTSVCLPKVDYGESCWNYFDCPAGMVCNMSRICACNARCGKSHEGTCQLASEQTCNSNSDCGTDSTCARNLECLFNPCFPTDNCSLGGLCMPTQLGLCWGHSSCGEDMYCKGLKLCPANTECPDNDQPGECAPQEEIGGCCTSYFACGAGLRCMSAVNKDECILDVSSTCVPYGKYNEVCYADEDCAPNRKCVGASICACGQDGCTPKAGSCALF